MIRFNAWLASRLATALSTMWMFWVLTLAVFFALAAQRPMGAQAWILFWVSIFFQGVALPVLAFVSTQQGDRLETAVQATHEAVMAELADIKSLREAEAEELAILRQHFATLAEKTP